MRELAITAANAITAVGHDGAMTAASVRAGISRMVEYGAYLDQEDNPITAAPIRGIENGLDTPTRMARIAALCLKERLAGCFQGEHQRPAQLQLFLGVASGQRPGPRYEEGCIHPLREMMAEWAENAEVQTIAQGNASLQYAIAEAGRLIESSPGALCIVGGVDSLLRDSTLNWFEQGSRLKSTSYGRHHGLIAGEAVGFLIVEDLERAKQADKPILARIAGLGVAEEPMPRAGNAISRNTGLTHACQAALAAVPGNDVCAVFADLNGENPRAKEWGMAEMRSLSNRAEPRQLWNPADCYGDVGAASGAVLATIVTQGFVRGWLRGPVLVTCSDDHGPCGALVMDKG
ncbi:MAG: 3-oxoacyl-ACP synthase [Geobacteraceae bacterium]|nr:3-oxoacyl-ACP synthase [Geobacteraceae bacterium]